MGLGHVNHIDTWVINQDELGVYECRVQKYLGEASAAIEVFRSCDRLSDDCFKRLKQITPTMGTQNSKEELNGR